MTKQLPRVLRTCAALACCTIFLAASCEKTKPDPKPATNSASNNATTQTTGTTTQTAGSIQPDDVGPKSSAIFMLSGLKGYTEPCGCTLDVMLGGIDRIAGYVDAARPLYDDVIVVDGGDLWFETKTLEEHEVPQEKAKIALVAKGLKDVGVKFTVPGEKDFALGAQFYFDRLADAGITPIAANLTVEGHELKASATEGKRLFVGVVDPEHYADIDGVAATDAATKLKELNAELGKHDVGVLLVHGKVPFAKKMLEAAPNADFALVGHEPRETDQVDQLGDGYTLEPYDQGRYLGILKLYNSDGAASKKFVDANPVSKAELEKIERQIAHVNESIDKLPPATPGEESPMLTRLRQRLGELQQRRTEIKTASIEVPDATPSFIWRSIPLEPGLPVDTEIAAARDAYNRELKKLNMSLDREPIPAEAGKAEFIGTDNCASCHAGAKTFYDDTKHAVAWKTLVERDKDFDQKCVGCHSVGYEQPGGSVIGKFEYEASISVVGAETKIQKNLVNVGCESCHGPGSLHVAAPVDNTGAPQHIIRDPTVEQCNQCHVPEHSPRFNFGVYVDQITGDGHARSQ